MGFKEDLSTFTHAKIHIGELMKKHTAFGVGGSADYYLEPESLYALCEALSLCKRYKVPYKLIGNGTNVLVSDKGYRGLIINVKKINSIFVNKNSVRVMAGATLFSLIKIASEKGLSGLEWASGIPATVGGAVVMNAGAFGHSISERVSVVETLFDGKIRKYDNSECKFAYRTSKFLGKKEIVVSATFILDSADKNEIKERINAYRELRVAVQPNGRSCGSVFKNPKGYTAGKLIESAGLKGSTIGGAKVSNKHANFILAEGKTCARDIAELIDYVKRRVYTKYNVLLKEEIEYVGEF